MSPKEDYTLQYLQEKFTGHSEEVEERQKQEKIGWSQNRPEEPLPVHLADDFNLPLAFKVMIDSILEIQKNQKGFNEST